MTVSVLSLMGIMAYGLSFMLFILLLSRLNMSYLVPVATGLSYTLLMLASVFIFNEHLGAVKILGCFFILIGILFVIAGEKI